MADLNFAYGRKARIGHISPALWDTTAYEYAKILPEGAIMVIKTLTVQELTPEHFEEAFKTYEDAAVKLALEDLDYMTVGGSPVVSMKGAGSDRDLISRIEKKINIPTTTTITAAMDAFKAMSVKRLAVVTPYPEARDRERKRFLEGNGFQVVNIKGMGILKNIDLAKQPLSSAYNLAKKVYQETPDIDGIYISCGRWPTVDLIDLLEKELKKPVFTSVQTVAWSALRALKLKANKGYGSLLEIL